MEQDDALCAEDGRRATDRIRALVVGLGYASDPAAVTVELRPYKGPGERSTRKGWRTAAVRVHEDRARDVAGAGPCCNGRDDDAATSALAERLLREVAWEAGVVEGSAKHSRAMAERARREAEEHDAEGRRRDARAAMLRALLEDGA